MMGDDIPQWAKERADELAIEERDEHSLSTGANHFRNAFARYIAEHEEPPVDPLLIEARKLAAQNAMERGANRDVVDHYETASASDPELARVITVLKRGIELGRQS